MRPHSFVLSLCTIACLATNAQAQADPLAQASRIAEALKQVSSRTKQPGYYSSWQVKGDRIPLWSRQCLGREMTPQQFEEDEANAGAVVVCILRDVIKQEIRSAKNNEAVAVQRTAAWWVTGDPNRYNNANVADYTKQVLGAYQTSTGSTIASRPTPNPAAMPEKLVPTQELPVDFQPGKPAIAAAPTLQPTAQPKPSPTASPKPTPKPAEATKPPEAAKPIDNSNPNTPLPIKPNGTNFYDRYMQTGYAASKAKNFEQAIVFFRRALDERPGDSFSQKAIENMEKLMQKK
jgi:hypothetical protein